MSPHCSLSLFSRVFLGGVLLVPLLSFSQSIIDPLDTPDKTTYPGVYQSFEKIIEFDEKRFNAKEEKLVGANTTITEIKDIETVDIDPDFLNSIILNSKSGYLKIASKDRCSFYDSLLADLLRTKEGKIERVFIQYQDKSEQNISAIIAKKDFLEKVIFKACPKSKEVIDMFQIKAIDKTIGQTNFEIPTNVEQCNNTYYKWLEDPKTPYWCQIHELLEDASNGTLQKMTTDSKQRKINSNKLAVSKILKKKMSDTQQEFLRNFCTNADNPKLFCSEFFSTSFFAKVVEGSKPHIYIKDICQTALNKDVWSPPVMRECARLLRANQNACLFGSIEKSGISPRPRCDHLSKALNFSSLLSDYDDCPRHSDQQAVTNMARVIKHIENTPNKPFSGFCSAISAGTFFEFNKKYGNEDIWKSQICYMDRVEDKEKCLPLFFGEYNNLEINVTNAVKEVLFRTRGASKDTKCEIVLSKEFNPNLLQYRFGCYIVVEENNCGLGNCGYRVFFNEKELKDLKFQHGLPIEYFATNLVNEKYSQTYILQKDAKKKTKAISTLTALSEFFKQAPKGIIHGVGCSEDLMPGFFKKYAMNQCTPLPFIVDGIIQEGDRVVLVTRTAADNIHAPRLVSWSNIYSAVKSYQVHHPVNQWTFYAIY
jgi:hypothetical protein